jgi:hypothetical protein
VYNRDSHRRDILPVAPIKNTCFELFYDTVPLFIQQNIMSGECGADRREEKCTQGVSGESSTKGRNRLGGRGIH